MQTLSESQRARFDEVLARSEKTVGASKAALYLSIGGEPYELVTWYGFKEAPRPQVAGNDLMVERLITRKSAYWINGATSDKRFYDVIHHAGSDSLLVVPIRAKRQLVGFIDYRDKTDKKPFAHGDLPNAKEIVDEIVTLFAEFGMYEMRDVDAPSRDGEPSAAQTTQRVLDAARQVAERDLSIARPEAHTLSEPEVDAAAAVLPGMLLMSGVVMTAFTALGHFGDVQRVASRATVTDAALDAFESKLRTWVHKQPALEYTGATRRTVTTPFGEGGPHVQPAHIASVLSAPILAAGVPGLILSIVFETPPNRQTRVALEHYLSLMQQAVTHAVSHYSLRSARQKVAELLLEPDFQRFPDLREHCQRISMLAEEFAQFVGLPPEEVETIRLAAFVHDVGMRMLDYKRLYKKPQYTDEDVELVQQHPIVGAAQVLESGLGDDVARIVLSHHERPDGKGYPNGLSGEQIPVGARIIHICDAFEAMTSLQSYQPAIPESAAVTQILRSAGAEFDLELARRFDEMLARVSAFGIE
jgi:putative nucleotidyltransferase with HDIG domain